MHAPWSSRGGGPPLFGICAKRSLRVPAPGRGWRRGGSKRTRPRRSLQPVFRSRNYQISLSRTDPESNVARYWMSSPHERALTRNSPNVAPVVSARRPLRPAVSTPPLRHALRLPRRLCNARRLPPRLPRHRRPAPPPLRKKTQHVRGIHSVFCATPPPVAFQADNNANP